MSVAILSCKNRGPFQLFFTERWLYYISRVQCLSAVLVLFGSREARCYGGAAAYMYIESYQCISNKSVVKDVSMEKFFTKPSAMYVFTSAPVLARTLLHTSASLLLVEYEWLVGVYSCFMLFLAHCCLCCLPVCLSVCLSVRVDRPAPSSGNPPPFHAGAPPPLLGGPQATPPGACPSYFRVHCT